MMSTRPFSVNNTDHGSCRNNPFSLLRTRCWRHNIIKVAQRKMSIVQLCSNFSISSLLRSRNCESPRSFARRDHTRSSAAKPRFRKTVNPSLFSYQQSNSPTIDQKQWCWSGTYAVACAVAAMCRSSKSGMAPGTKPMSRSIAGGLTRPNAQVLRFAQDDKGCRGSS